MKEDSTVANGRTFLVTDGDGRLSRSYDGLYHADVRHLVNYDLSATRSIELLDITSPRPGERVIHAGSALDEGARSHHIARNQLVTDSLVERLEVTNLESDSIEETLSLSLEADFDDLFEVRGHVDGPERSIDVSPREDGVTFSYTPADIEFRRATHVRAAADGAVTVSTGATDATVTVTLSLSPRETRSVYVAVIANRAADRAPLEYERAEDRLDARAEHWDAIADRPSTSRKADEAVLEQSSIDLLSLTMDTEYGPVLTAGTPWFATAFGRDSLIAAYQMLPWTAEPAVATLRYLADYQATDADDYRAATPGKIFHELRHGELTVREIVPHSPYYGTIDATALFVILLHETWRQTGARDLVADLWSNVERALEWLSEYGDSDDDGFLEYPTNEGGGGKLTHRAWKDSGDGIVHPDGSHPSGPLAVAEVQGYYYDALVRAADCYRRLRDDEETAADLEAEATALATRFDEEYWIPDESYYAVALDGDGERVDSVTTNPGHGLWSGIIPEHRSDDVIDRLVADDMFTGWGIRTLSRAHAAYNPQSYHLGSVWPHDNSLVALGMANYGRRNAAQSVADGLFDAARKRGPNRLPELFAGFDREKSAIPIEYGVACEPQAWAAGTPIALLGALNDVYNLTHVGNRIR